VSTHHHPHEHEHEHEHNAHHHADGRPAPYADVSVPDCELRPADLRRRQFLQSLGLLGVAAAGGGMLGGAAAMPAAAQTPAPAANADPRSYAWLAGDHHIHTQYSYDAMHTVAQQVDAGAAFGLDWMVITDHGYLAHEKYAVEQTYADVLAARAQHRRMLLWQGLEWNVPSGEHATVFFETTKDEITALHAFERLFDGNINGTNPSSDAHEAVALEALRWMSSQVDNGVIDSALMLANHPSRNGRYSPHELRAYRDTAPDIVVGMEGAPGAQHDGAPPPGGTGGGFRGGYGNSPGTDSWTGWPMEAYRTWGGFDWMTAKLGGMWDSMLAEGKGWWITTNSDIHRANGSTLASPTVPSDWYATYGKFPDPVDTGTPHIYADFWPGQFSRTVVGAADRSFRGVMDGIRGGRVWVCMGGLIEGLDVRVGSDGTDYPATLGGRVSVRRGEDVSVRIQIRLATTPNSNGDIPRLARADLIRGAVTGPVSDRETYTAADVAVVRSFEPGPADDDSVVFRHTFRNVQEPFYLRLRGTDGRRHADGGIEPLIDVYGDADPWADLWFYANPVFVDVR
jgi:PHP domain